MKVLFIVNALHHWERIGILTLSSILKRSGHHVLLQDIRGKSHETILGNVAASAPDVLAYSTMTNEAGTFLHINQLIRRNPSKAMKSVFGGPHPTFCPEMVTEEGVDAVCRGDAEESFLHYLEYLEGARRPDQVSGFLIRHRKDVIENPLGSRTCDLDLLPFADRGLWDLIDPHPVQKSFFASRGCPYQCSYCFNPAYNELYGNPTPIVRRRSVENLISEIQDVIKQYPWVHPFFDDDSLLSAPVAWIGQFAECYRHDVGRPFGCNIRADQVSEKMIEILSEAGWRYCWFGVECGDEGFANRVMHRNMTNDQLRHAARLLRSHGIWFATQNINALPTDRPLETDEETLQLNIECKPDFAMAHVFSPFPGTKMAEFTKEKGLFDGNYVRLNDPLCLSSPLQFDPKRKREMERQNRLFGPVVALPWLKPLLPFLRKLPLTRLYALAHFVYLGYCTRIKLAPVRRGLQNYRSLIALLLRRFVEAG